MTIQIDDLDCYRDVDQKLLQDQLPQIVDHPLLIELEDPSDEPIRLAAIAAQIRDVQPVTLSITAPDSSRFELWQRLDTGAEQLEFTHRLGEPFGGPLIYDELPLDRLTIDLRDIAPSSWESAADWLQRCRLAQFAKPLRVIVPAAGELLSQLDSLLAILAVAMPATASIALAPRQAFPASPEEMHSLTELLMNYGSAFRFYLLNPYRLIRLHLYHRLPFWRLFISGGGIVYPYPQCPLALGSLHDQPLTAIWQAAHHDFWQRPETAAALLDVYRLADLAALGRA